MDGSSLARLIMLGGGNDEEEGGVYLCGCDEMVRVLCYVIDIERDIDGRRDGRKE